MSNPVVYLAGPGVFRRDAQRIAERLKELCRLQGLEGIWPTDNDPSEGTRAKLTRGELATFIFKGNLAAIRAADAVIADISPFRGPHCDCGTAFELGFAGALNKPLFAYSDHGSQPLISRITAAAVGTICRDAKGDLIEDFGLPENLMIGCNVGPVSFTAESAIERCARYLRSEEAA